MRLGGQVRVVALALGGARVLGVDMMAAFALARALAVPEPAVAEWLPMIEAEMVRKLNDEGAARSGGLSGDL